MGPSSNQSIPAAYVAGSITVPANVVSNLLVLIQQQLAPNCPGSPTEFRLEANPGSPNVNVGAASQLSGPLTATNYSYQLIPSGPPRIYRSSYPGNNTPLGELQLFSGGLLSLVHVEVVA
jgi:hypothetical protein